MTGTWPVYSLVPETVIIDGKTESFDPDRHLPPGAVGIHLDGTFIYPQAR